MSVYRSIYRIVRIILDAVRVAAVFKNYFVLWKNVHVHVHVHLKNIVVALSEVKTQL